MNNGIIAGRYATAFLALVGESSDPEAVRIQVSRLLSLMGRLPELRKALCSAVDVTLEDKLSLMRTAVEPDALCDPLRRLMILMHTNSRAELFRLALLDFLTLYRQQKGLVMVRITTTDGNHDLDEYVRDLSEESFGGKAEIVTASDPDMIGGFIIDSWGYRLDASVRTQLKNLRRALTAITKRSV